MQTPIFIVSTGRCGSTLVSNILRTHPDILSISEFWPSRINLDELFSEKIMSGKEYWDLLSVPMAPDIYKIALDRKISQVPKHTLHEKNYMRRIALPLLVKDYNKLFEEIKQYVADIPEAKPAEIILKMFDFIRRRLNKKVWIERTGASLDFLPNWKKMWPCMKVIHIYRDGRDCAISMSKHHAFRLQIMRREICKLATFYKFVQIPPEQINLEEFYANKIPLEKFGELWNIMIMKGLDELSEIPFERRLDFSYENLTENPETVLRELIDFIDPSINSDEWIRSQTISIHKGCSNWKSLEQIEQVKLADICREGLIRLNYNT